MNIVKELRLKKGVQQKELALSIGVSQAAVSDWEKNKKNPKGENLRKLAEYFGVDEQFVLGYGLEDPNLFIPENPKISGISETEQIVQYVLDKLNVQTDKTPKAPKTPEARAVSFGMDNLPKEQRELILNMVTAMYPNTFTKGNNDDEA